MSHRSAVPYTAAENVTELALSGLTLGRIFDAFYAYIPTLHGGTYGNLSNIATSWRRNVRDLFSSAKPRPDFEWEISFTVTDRTEFSNCLAQVCAWVCPTTHTNELRFSSTQSTPSDSYVWSCVPRR